MTGFYAIKCLNMSLSRHQLIPSGLIRHARSVYSTSSILFVDRPKNRSIVLAKHQNSTSCIALSPTFSTQMRLYSDEVKKSSIPPSPDQGKDKKGKKQSKFKMFYRQYGPSFLVIHLTTVVAWIYVFFLISKQGYDITQLLVLFEKIGIMSNETVQSIHQKIENYKPETLKGYITGNDIKHFVTAYMVYKVIAPFRYMVSIWLTRMFVVKLRSKGIFKS